MVSIKKPKKSPKNTEKQWFKRYIDVTEKLKNNKFYRFFSYTFRMLFWLLLILTAIYWIIIFYGDNAEISEKTASQLEGYEAVLTVLTPATPLIEKQRELALNEIVKAKADDKVTVGEFVRIEGMYENLERTLMDLVVESLATKETEKNKVNDSASQDKGK